MFGTYFLHNSPFTIDYIGFLEMKDKHQEGKPIADNP